jgi:7-cyano-7-deazaguanine reductase
MGIFMENIANKILDDVVRACNPKALRVTGKFTPRGGLESEIIAEHGKWAKK